jgi:hypothetical protein
VFETNTKVFFLSICFIFGGVVLDLDKYIFPWQGFFFLGGGGGGWGAGGCGFVVFE